MKIARYYSCGISPVNRKLCWEVWDRKEGKKILISDAQFDQIKEETIDESEVKSDGED